MRWNYTAVIFLLVSFLTQATTSPSCSPETSWKTVDHFQAILGRPATLSGLGTWRNYAYASGEAFAEEGFSWIVRRSIDFGETWKTVSSISGGSASGIAVDERNGHVYVVGRLSIGKWIVRKSVNHGLTWKTVDDFRGVGSSDFVVNKIAVDRFGNVTVVGQDSALSDGERPILRRSEDGGKTWKTIAFASDVFVPRVVLGNRDRSVIVAGYGIPPRPDLNGPKWTVYHSSNGKTGWKIVDRFTLTDNLTNSSVPVGGAVAPDGKILLVGFATESGEDSRHWIVRESSLTNPADWRTLDNYRPLDFSLGFGEAWAMSATYSRGLPRVFVNGQEKRPGMGLWDALVREGFPPLRLFTPSDLVTDSSTVAEGLSYDFVGGMVTMRNNQVLSGLNTPRRGSRGWFIRKMTCPL